MKKLAIFFYFLCYVQSINKEHNPKELVEQYNNYKNSHFYDPDHYIQSREKIINTLHELIDKTNFLVYLFIISEMPSTYNIENFTDELSINLLDNDKSKEKNSLIILFSIEDKKMRIRTGENTRNIFSDSLCLHYLESIKNYLRKNNYDEGIYQLVQSLYNRSMSSNFSNFFEDLWINLGVYLMIILLAFYLICNNCKRTTSLDSSAEAKLNRIKEISQKFKSKKEFIEKTCTICLEDFENYKIEEPSNLQSNLIVNEHITKDEEKVSKAILECGHCFHNNCIAQWMLKQNNCPVCREMIDKEDLNTKPLSQDLVNVQTGIHPSFSLLNFNYNNDFTWYIRSNNYINSGGHNSVFSGWNLGSGGASSGW